jgi:exosortase A-associated hydrolase 1
MNNLEIPVTFDCNGEKLLGIVHRPEPSLKRGIVIIVGGPQYRVGSHRQFVLLARTLASNGYPVIRYDYRGMGDSEGNAITFEESGPDLAITIDTFFRKAPQITEIVLFGLCDAASTALMYAYQDSRIIGLILLNPWVRTEVGEAKAYVKHYYFKRFKDADFWRKLFAGEFEYVKSLKSFKDNIGTAFGFAKIQGTTAETIAEYKQRISFPLRMRYGMERFEGRVLLILSSVDLTAAEFKDTINSCRKWRKLLERRSVTRQDLKGANHTFSRQEWRDQVAKWCIDWLESW